MPRPCKQRRVGHIPHARIFKPQGVPLKELEGLTLGLDQLEALRLADLEGLKLEDVGEAMGVSRATAGRIVEAGHRIVAQALVEGRALSIGGGPVMPSHGGGGRRRRKGPGHLTHNNQGENMPNQDGTGPMGEGSQTGRGAGPCGQPGRGQGRGQGGQGRGQGGQGQGRGQGRGQGQGQGQGQNNQGENNA